MAKANESVSPVTIPSGRRRPPVSPAESTTGSTGRTHGDTAVAAPAANANAISATTVHSLAGADYDSVTDRPRAGLRPTALRAAGDAAPERRQSRSPGDHPHMRPGAPQGPLAKRSSDDTRARAASTR